MGDSLWARTLSQYVTIQLGLASVRGGYIKYQLWLG